MSTQLHSVTYSVQSKTSNDFVLLEQEPWDPYVGMLTKVQFITALNKIMFSGKDSEPNCASDGLMYSSKVYAYPSREDLAYSMGWVNALNVDKIIQFPIFTELLQCNMEQDLDLKYPAMEIISAGWKGGAYSSDGAIVTPPALTLTDTGAHVASKVYGTVIVKYKVCQHLYPFSVQRRVDAIENPFTAFAYAIWDGGNEFIELKAPEGAEESQCNNSGSVDIIPDKPRPDHVDPEDQFIKIDYCDQTVIED